MNLAPGALRVKRVDAAVGFVKRLVPLSFRPGYYSAFVCWYGKKQQLNIRGFLMSYRHSFQQYEVETVQS